MRLFQRRPQQPVPRSRQQPPVPAWDRPDPARYTDACAAAHLLFRVEPTDRALAGWLPPQALTAGDS